jgi:hypothetical protein
MPLLKKKLQPKQLIFLLLAAYTILQVYCINQLSVNYDEPLFAAYGISILKFQANKDVQQFDSKLPIVALNMLPRAVEQLFKPGLKKEGAEWEKDIIAGRYISLIASLLLGLLIYAWSKELYGSRTGIYTLLIYLLSPDFLAHGIFVSTDIYASLWTTSSFYFLWKFRDSNQLKYFFLASLSVALGQISKFSLLHLLILIPFILLITHSLALKNWGKSLKLIYLILIFIAINWFVISAAHFFYHEFMMLDHYRFKSNVFIGLQTFFGKLTPFIPVPFPESYINSMDLVMYADNLGGGVSGSLNAAPYILGETSQYGFWYYYFVTLFYKLPVTTLLIWNAGFLIFLAGFNAKRFLKDDIFFFVPAFYFLIYLSFFYTTQIGIRHLLIIYPLLYVLSGRAIQTIIEKKKQIVLTFLLICQAISVFSYFPHFLPYTNEFITNKKLAYKKIADSSLCYGEGKFYLNRYLKKNKDVLHAPANPQAGKFVVEINELYGLHQYPQIKYDWLKNMHPSQHIHSQYLVFEINTATADSLKKLYP